MVILELPWPPSVNHYWRMGNNRIYLGSEGRRYKAIVTGIVRYAQVDPLEGNISIKLQAYPPDRRRRDLDNIQKAIWDSLGKAGLYNDDSQIKHVEAWMLEPVEDGKVVVCVAKLNGNRIDPPLAPVFCN